MRLRLFILIAGGVGGVALLLSLGIWQVQRLAWKQGILADIQMRIAAEPMALPNDPNPEMHRFAPVILAGVVEPDHARVLIGLREHGPSYRIIAPMALDDGRRILLDRGVISVHAATPEPPTTPMRVIGNLHWPDDRDGYTPENDIADNVWFARDLDALAAQFNTAPLLVVAQSGTDPSQQIHPLPLGTEGIPNNHLGYAITWFSLSAVWLGMTALLLWRITRRSAE